MPKCKICQSFFVVAQSVNNLFKRIDICVHCSTYQHQEILQSTVPFDDRLVELYTCFAGEHPYTNYAFFKYVGHEITLFFEPEWVLFPEAFLILNKLLNPLKLYYYTTFDTQIFQVLEKLEGY